MTEALSQKGSAEGFEQVSSRYYFLYRIHGLDINNYFTSLIDVVEEYGGDVYKFAGDALICVFVDTEPIATVSRCAECALYIQHKLKKYEKGSIQLTLHVGAHFVKTDLMFKELDMGP